MTNGMNLFQLQQAVYYETNRPDLVPQTLQSILASTLKMHTIELFYKDIVEGVLKFPEGAWIQSANTASFPRFRRMAYCRKYDPCLQPYQLNPTLDPPIANGNFGIQTAASRLNFFKFLEPQDIMDPLYKHIERQDVAYIAGTKLWLKSCTKFSSALAAWYAFPNIDATTPDDGVTFPNFESWIATERPYAIVYDAASSVLQKTGMTDAARKYDRSPNLAQGDNGGLVQDEIRRLIADNITTGGN